MKLYIHSQTSVVQPLKFANGQVILSHILFGIQLFIHAYTRDLLRVVPVSINLMNAEMYHD